MPATAVVPCLRVKVAELTVKGSIASLKARAILAPMATFVAALAGGTVAVTMGRVVSRVAPVVKLQTKSAGSGLPARSLAAVVIVAVYVVRGARMPAGVLVKTGNLMSLESRVTAAVRANSRPSTVAPVVTVIEAKARMFPLNTEVVPRVAELPTCQKMLAAWAPPLKKICRPDVMVNV